MRPITKIVSFVLAPLVGATLFATAPAAAKAAEPYSVFKISNVKYTKKAKPGGWVKYSFTAKNTGPHPADYYWIGGILPKGVDGKKKIYYSGPKGTQCDWAGREFWCWSPYILEVDDAEQLTIQFRLKKNAKGAQVGEVGVIAFDVPHGAEDLDRQRLKELGIKGWYFTKKVRTLVVKK